MKNRSIKFVRRASAAGAILGAALLVGCSSGNESPAYPAPSSQSAMSGNMGTSLKVPAGATLVAASGYPIAPFTPPGNGTIYVYDVENNSVPIVTTGTAGQSIDLSTMQSANSTLNPQHQYRVYYVPSDKATTLPSELGG